ncbi:MAG: hypothetical protein AB7E47_05990 [Desulfovibrionaceae bacterium]
MRPHQPLQPAQELDRLQAAVIEVADKVSPEVWTTLRQVHAGLGELAALLRRVTVYEGAPVLNFKEDHDGE